MQYQFSYTYVGGDRYSGINRLSPAATIAHSSTQTTELYYAREFKKFFNSTLFPANSDRDGANDAIGIIHRAGLGKGMEMVLGYSYDKDSTDAAWWEYKGQKGSLELRANVSGVNLLLNASYYDKKYEDLNKYDDQRIPM